MPKVNLSRLIKKYGKSDIRGKKYERMMTDIISHNTKNISRAIGKLSQEQWEKGLKKLDRITYEKRQFIMPPLDEVLPKQDIYIRKGAEDGKLINRTLRDKLTNDLRETMEKYPAFRHSGINSGKVSLNAINNLQSNIKNTFVDYRKKDPRYGVPSNIKTIAITELRSVVDNEKYEYTKKLLEKNKDKFKVFKEWIQNRSLSKPNNYRRSHNKLNGMKVKFEDYFITDEYRKKGKRYLKTGKKIYLLYPHDPKASASESIGCNCDYRIIIKKIKKI